MVVTPPHAAASVPDSKSSMLRIPPTSASRWVCTSTPPGRTSSPAASISRRPAGSDGASAVTRPPSTPTSARTDSVAVTTVPPRTTISWLLLASRGSSRLRVEGRGHRQERREVIVEAQQVGPHQALDRAQVARPQHGHHLRVLVEGAQVAAEAGGSGVVGGGLVGAEV